MENTRLTKPCRICKVPKAVTELEKDGRCRFCADVKAASDAGMTYGKYQNTVIAQRPVTYTRVSAEPKYCRQCGDIIPKERRYSSFCSEHCQRVCEAKRVSSEEKIGKEYLCVQCGKVLPGVKRKYCSNACAYAAIQEKEIERHREAHQKKVKEKPVQLCEVCGQRIRQPKRRRYCSEACMVKGTAIKSRARREAKKK